MGTVTTSAEQEALHQAFREREGVDPLSTAALRLNADSIMENITAMRQAISQIEFLEERLSSVRMAVDAAKPHMIDAGLMPALMRIEEALKV